MTQEQFESKFSRENMLAWIAEQSEDRGFNYFDLDGCFFASFTRETFKVDDVVSGASNVVIDGVTYPFPLWCDDLANGVTELDCRFTIKDVKEIKF